MLGKLEKCKNNACKDIKNITLSYKHRDKENRDNSHNI
jgi:hypothetical protein